MQVLKNVKRTPRIIFSVEVYVYQITRNYQHTQSLLFVYSPSFKSQEEEYTKEEIQVIRSVRKYS